MSGLLKLSLSPNTRQSYERSWLLFHDFSKTTLRKTQTFPASIDNISLYVAHLGNSGKKASTIRTHLSALAFAHKINLLPDPTANFRVSKLILAISRKTGPSKKRDPIGIALLHCILAVLPRIIKDKYQCLLYKAVFSMMYHACLRAGEIVSSNTSKHTLRRNNIRTYNINGQQKLKLKFTSYKHSNGKTPSMRLDPKLPNKYCPIHLYQLYDKVAPSARYHAFTLINGEPLTRKAISDTLTLCTSHLSMKGLYNTHSFRIGKATDMVDEGYTDEQIITYGRWKSNAFRLYIRPDTICLP